jgi:hypothetical protein
MTAQSAASVQEIARGLETTFWVEPSSAAMPGISCGLPQTPCRCATMKGTLPCGLP